MVSSNYYLPIVTQDDNTDIVCLQVESHTLDSRLELYHLTSLHFGETEDSSDTITDGDNGSEFLEIILKQSKNRVNTVTTRVTWNGYRSYSAGNGKLL